MGRAEQNDDRDPATLSGIKFYDEAANKPFFGTADKPGQLSNTVQQEIDIWGSHVRLQVKPMPTQLINYSSTAVAIS